MSLVFSCDNIVYISGYIGRWWQFSPGTEDIRIEDALSDAVTAMVSLTLVSVAVCLFVSAHGWGEVSQQQYYRTDPYDRYPSGNDMYF